MFEQTLRFPCVSCKQIITDRSAVCPYCGAPVDPAVARAAAETQDKVNQAYSDASYLRTAAVGMWILLALSLLPFVPLVYYGFIFTFFIVLVLLIRWQVRFANINTGDPDYAKARRNKNLSLILWLVALPVGFVAAPLLSALVGHLLS
jgi:hypothetical protein